MKIIAAQLNFVVGDIDGNTNRILRLAGQDGLVVFPEMCITGYPAEDLWLNKNFIAREQAALQKIAREFQGRAVIGASHTSGGKLYNAAYLIQNGVTELVALKKHLPNYGVFDEARYFTSGDFYKLVDGWRVAICEDAWKECFDGAGIISINASPYEWGKQEKRIVMARAHGKPFYYINQIGGQDELVFDGGSFYVDDKGVKQALMFEEFVGELNGAPQALTKPESNFKAASLGLKDYVQKNGFSKVLLGVSGGIDSALVAAIAVNALGASNVRGVILPSKYSSKITMEDAYGVCKCLGIAHEEHVIWDNYKQETGLTSENMQSRIRGVMLMALSNKHGELLLTTGNKSEIATGYCTIYGDMNGAFNPIKDLYKTEVFEMAAWLGTLPPRVLTKAPTAELRENQTDQDSLPPYDVLDGILRQMIDGRKNEAEVEGFDKALVKKVAKLIKTSEFKRRQSAMGVKLSAVSFGRDWRMPISSGAPDGRKEIMAFQTLIF